jgi:hypothetical protein
MHWKKRQKQIQYLRLKHGSDRSLAREFPDLKVEQLSAWRQSYSQIAKRHQ